ncbi:hypothetical protein [Primorskyibacter sp. S187A]|uniref:hypothetical protein n=1 Tax=Primorskyibacter sp. S187A TaxID=3415130 RepID=UPI003C7AF077
MDLSLILPLSLLIALAAVALGWMALRRDPGKARGAKPGKGDHILTSDYQSGLGGHSTTWRVPADPQEYARKFVPQGRHKEK